MDFIKGGRYLTRVGNIATIEVDYTDKGFHYPYCGSVRGQNVVRWWNAEGRFMSVRDSNFDLTKQLTEEEYLALLAVEELTKE